MIQARLAQVLRLLRPDVAVPTILQVHDHAGQARARELEGHGATVTYVARTVPQVHADMDEPTIQSILRGGPPATVWYDEPTYAFCASPLHSTADEIRRRVEARVKLNTGGNPHPVGSSVVRAHLAAGPPIRLQAEDLLYTLEDVRRHTNSKALHDDGLTGRSTTVAVIDTGIDGGHPMLAGRVASAKTFVPEPAGQDGAGHGTWVASCIAGQPTTYQGKVEAFRGQTLQGMAPDATLRDYRALTSEGSGSTSSVIQALEAAIQDEVNLINMSLGSLWGGAGQTPDAQVVNEAARRGIHVVVAAGNAYGWLTIGSPGSAAGAITVGSVAMRAPHPGAVSLFSSKGPTAGALIKPTIAAPGGNLRPGEAILGATARGSVIDRESMDGGWALMRGTSMATPVVTGILAQLVPAGLPKSREALEEALANATTGDLWGVRLGPKNNRVGWGPIDASRLRAALQRPAGPLVKLYGAFLDRRTRPLLGGGLDVGAALQRLPTRPDAIRWPTI